MAFIFVFLLIVGYAYRKDIWYYVKLLLTFNEFRDLGSQDQKGGPTPTSTPKAPKKEGGPTNLWSKLLNPFFGSKGGPASSFPAVCRAIIDAVFKSVDLHKLAETVKKVTKGKVDVTPYVKFFQRKKNGGKKD